MPFTPEFMQSTSRFRALLIVFYVIFLTAYHVQTQRRGSAEMQSSMLEAKWSQAQTEMDAMRRSQAQTAVYQHDMRHHLERDRRVFISRPDRTGAGLYPPCTVRGRGTERPALL